jgi:DNA-binding CsgD family transcriptional regulator
MIDQASVAAPTNAPNDLLRAAITEASTAIAVCDHDFAVRFFNPAITRLIDPAAREPAPLRHGVALLQSLGVDDVEDVLADIASRGNWQGVTRRQTPDDAGAGRDLHVEVEPFGDAGSAVGWLITARELPTPAEAPMPRDERDSIARCGRLTPREREVMLALQAGATNKAIAQALKISPRTVEFHRARIMQRFAATSLVDLVRKVAADGRLAGQVEGVDDVRGSVR